MTAKPTRRLVTGVDAEGRSCVTADGPTPGFIDYGRATSSEIWVDDGGAPLASTDSVGDTQTLLPPKGGSVCRVFVLRPEGSADVDAQQEARFDTGDAMEAKHGAGPRWHTTQTIDYAVVLRGSVELHLDDGVHVLNAGDVVVQRATRHGWSNAGSEDCEIAFVLIDREE